MAFHEDAAGRKVSSSYLRNARSRCSRGQGLERVCRLGKNHWVVATVVPGARERG
jgi:hypothetical protein